VALDRDAILKQGEKLLRQGKLEGAIAEYVRLVEDQPRDWNTINALGDLYARAGQPDQAAVQYIRIADHLFSDGILTKAAALYRKALKVRPDDEQTLLQLAETSARQGLFADARASLRQLAKHRRDRGDERGALDCLVRLGSLEDADPEAQVAAGKAARALDDVTRAVRLYVAAAEGFETANRKAEALDALAEAARLAPDDQALRARMARECIASGQLDRASAFLSRETAGDDPDLLLTVGRIELVSGRDAEARITIARLLSVAPARRADVLAMVEDAASAGHLEAVWSCIDLLVDDALLGGDMESAIASLESFTSRCPHIPALMRLVEVAVDAGQDEVMRQAQGRLADAYLDAGRGNEARVIAEDLMAYAPDSDAHAGRLRRALELVGEADVEQLLERYREPVETFDDLLELDSGVPEPAAANEPQAELEPAVVPEPAADEEPEAEPEPAAVDVAASAPERVVEEPGPVEPSSDEGAVVETVEVDLSEALAGLLVDDVPTQTADAPDLEVVFEGIRGRAAREREVAEALDCYERGVRHLEAGREDQAIGDLTTAARTPMLRFVAAVRLGRLHMARGEGGPAIEWLERAAEAPAPAPEDGVAVLYDLAAALQDAGESARALAILMEIDADVAAYRDVPQRIEQLRVRSAGA
jgi:tetratricopeptide (TPR) repeat protein